MIPGGRLRRPASTRSAAAGGAATITAWTAFAVGGAYAALSAYWGLGGTALAGTVGGPVEHQVRSGSATGLIIVWAAATVKLVAAVLPLAAVGLVGSSAIRPWARRLSWIEATVLTVYGLVLTAGGLLVQANVVAASRHADHRALAWHAFLWDPWFLTWGVLVTIAMVASRRRERPKDPPPSARPIDSEKSGAGHHGPTTLYILTNVETHDDDLGQASGFAVEEDPEGGSSALAPRRRPEPTSPLPPLARTFE